ncbi:hypothetical protein Lser_V15G04112 [Lactuca serriola]
MALQPRLEDDPLVKALKAFEIENLKSLVGDCEQDKDMRAMAYEELEQALKEEGYVHNLLLKALLPKDDEDERDCILEVRAVHHDSRYESYSLKKFWRFEVVDVTEDDRLGNCFMCLINLKNAMSTIALHNSVRKMTD